MARIALNEEEEKLQKLFKRKSDYEEEARILMSSKLDVHKINENSVAITTMQEFILQQQKEVQKAEAVLEKARMKLAETMKERKVQEVLRDNAFEQFLQDENMRDIDFVEMLMPLKHILTILKETD